MWWSKGALNRINKLNIYELLGKKFEAKFLANYVLYLSVPARLESWSHCMPERFWDMQHNKHFATQNFGGTL